VPIERALIGGLLADSRIEDFEQSPVFTSQIQDRPEAAIILLDIMRNESPATGARARAMLALFDEPALGPIGQALALDGAVWRRSLLNLLWALITAHETREWRALLDLVVPDVLPLFTDETVIPADLESGLEIEYEYRVCDEAYTTCQRLLHPEFDESLFRGLDFHERDGEIRVLQSRLSRTLA
jgi:hypothetical protein